MHRLSLLTVLALSSLALAVPVALAGSPHFVGNATTATRTDDSLIVSGKEAGLGDEAQIHIVVSATALCINRGGNHPKAVNKESVSAEGDFPVQNGKADFSLTAGVQPADDGRVHGRDDHRHDQQHLDKPARNLLGSDFKVHSHRGPVPLLTAGPDLSQKLSLRTHRADRPHPSRARATRPNSLDLALVVAENDVGGNSVALRALSHAALKRIPTCVPKHGD